MWRYLRTCKKVYYIIHPDMSGETEDMLPPGYTGEYIGEYRIGYYICHIYKLIPNGEHGE
ncbi:MAG: hypothetical protein LUC88_03605 [Prevotella sp.]|nr:hypothetical protein [Prevotella sp.]